ncbi:MAG: hypothetical protein Q8Q04_03660 [archaeon]|nr:hypothetical protein [archaeon]
MKRKLNSVLNEVLEEINPSEDELKVIRESLKKFESYLKKRIKKLKIDADLFVGGSFSKNTLIRKNFYDIDLFLRYGKKHAEKDFFKLSKKILRFVGGVSVIHGSRDYFRVKGNSFFLYEVVPVRRISRPSEAVNITDLSYLHSRYINRKIKNKKILDEIKLGKAFCHGTKTYGAETYVRGFSGYSIELLIYYFKSFERFLNVLSKNQDKKLIVDIEKFYKREDVLIDMNGSKLDSPVILVDPTYKARNALAALSYETFKKFQVSARAFLKNPLADFFIPKKIDFQKVKSESQRRGFQFLRLKLKTKKDKGDIAGAKLLKFFNHLEKEFEKYFEVKIKDFEYIEGKAGEGYFVLSPRKEIVFKGPSVKDEKNSIRFKKEHANTYEKKGRFYAYKKVDFSSREFLRKWAKKNKMKIKEMSISGIEGY